MLLPSFMTKTNTAPEGSQENSAPSSPDKLSPAEEATELIANCREDIKSLWMDDVVRKVLKKPRVRLEDSAGL